MPFSAPCVSSCVVLRDATLSSSKPFTLVAAGTEEETGHGQTLDRHTISFSGHTSWIHLEVIVDYYETVARAIDSERTSRI